MTENNKIVLGYYIYCRL